MAAVPFDVRLNAAIREVDEQIARARDNVAGYSLRAKPIPPPIDAIGALTRLLERRHALLLQRTYPNARVYTQITFGPVMDETGQAVWLRGSRGRRPDIGVLDGTTLYLVEAKVLNEILNMFPKGSPTRRAIEVELKRSSTFGRQWRTERSLLNRAFKTGGYQAFNGTYVLGGREELLVLVTSPDAGGSRPAVYGNMGDGLPIKGPGAAPGTTIQRIQPIDLQPSPDAIRAAKLNKPVTGASKTKSKDTAVTPDDLRAAKSTRGVVIPKVDRSNTPARGVVNETPNRMVDGRATTGSGPSSTSTKRSPGGTYETPSASWTKSTGGNLRAAGQAVAQAFHDFMERGMHGSAKAAAERARSRQWFVDKVFEARKRGAWVLITAQFAESDIANAGGARHFIFQGVELRFRDQMPGEDPELTLHRLRTQVKPGSAQWAWSGDQTRSGNFNWEGWHSVSQDMELYPGEPAEEVISQPDPTGLGVGRCVVRKLR